ncbi:MAG: tetratricopeptide repeat protein, partial [Planctomycetes bacterium]|nr:tetratricopeptide repeat protein [Planctomycetota bacterium]
MLRLKTINTGIRWICILLLYIVVAGCGNKVNYHNKEGLLLYNKGKYSEAITEFKKALELNPNHYDAHFN